METLCGQIKLAHASKLNIIILGDINLDANKWLENDFSHKRVAEILRDSSQSCPKEWGCSRKCHRPHLLINIHSFIHSRVRLKSELGGCQKWTDI